MKRRNRSYKRGEPFRDARLFVIVCEGEKREKNYFEKLGNNSKRLKIEILASEGEHFGKSSPNHLLSRAAQYVAKNGIGESDFLWFVLDVDNWEKEHIYTLVQACNSRSNWFYSISNPCFEVWLWFHYHSPESLSQNTCREIKRALSNSIKRRI